MTTLISKALEILLNRNSEPARLAAMAVESFAKAQAATETSKAGEGYLTLRFEDHNDREVFVWAMACLQKFFDEEQTYESEESVGLRGGK